MADLRSVIAQFWGNLEMISFSLYQTIIIPDEIIQSISCTYRYNVSSILCSSW